MLSGDTYTIWAGSMAVGDEPIDMMKESLLNMAKEKFGLINKYRFEMLDEQHFVLKMMPYKQGVKLIVDLESCGLSL